MMKFSTILTIIAAASCLANPAFSEGFEVGEAEFKRYRELANDGYQPIAAGGVGNSMIGMQKNETLYICFLADDEKFHEIRQSTIIDHIENGTAPKPVPNVPLVCVQAE